MIGSRVGFRKRPGKGRFAPTSEINITPFVDVMLVLLIIFMVAAPLLTVSVPVDLPRVGEAATPPPSDAKPLTVTVVGDGRIFLQEDEVTFDNLVGLIQSAAGGATDQRIYVRGDRTVNYERVMQVMNLINSAGFTHIGLMGSISQAAN